MKKQKELLRQAKELLKIAKKIKSDKKKYYHPSKYVQLNGMYYVPECLAITYIFFYNDPNYKDYQLCFVGAEESVKGDLKKWNWKDTYTYPFKHMPDKSLMEGGEFFSIPTEIKKEISKLNKIVSNPDSIFNQLGLGDHTPGLVSKKMINLLQLRGYGTSLLMGLRVFGFTLCDSGYYAGDPSLSNCSKTFPVCVAASSLKGAGEKDGFADKIGGSCLRGEGGKPGSSVTCYGCNNDGAGSQGCTTDRVSTNYAANGRCLPACYDVTDRGAVVRGGVLTACTNCSPLAPQNTFEFPAYVSNSEQKFTNTVDKEVSSGYPASFKQKRPCQYVSYIGKESGIEETVERKGRPTIVLELPGDIYEEGGKIVNLGDSLETRLQNLDNGLKDLTISCQEYKTIKKWLLAEFSISSEKIECPSQQNTEKEICGLEGELCKELGGDTIPPGGFV